MKKQKTYAFVCLLSLLLFFTSPVIFISGVVFDMFSDISVEQADLLENESDNKKPAQTPLEEEQHIDSLEFNEGFPNEYSNGLPTIYLNQNWTSISISIITPPPDLA